MKENMIMVESLTDSTVVINIPEIPFRRTWPKMGAKLPVEREVLERAFYDVGVENLFRQGILSTDDEEFLKEVGLMDEDKVLAVTKVSDAFFNRMIKLMPLQEFKKELAKLSSTQREELADYAIENYTNLNMDRIDILSKATGKNILKAIENYKADQEG